MGRTASVHHRVQVDGFTVTERKQVWKELKHTLVSLGSRRSHQTHVETVHENGHHRTMLDDLYTLYLFKKLNVTVIK